MLINSSDLDKVKQVVEKYFISIDGDLFLFGSQATGQQTRISDYDIGYFADENLNPTQRENLREELENLDIPVKVDLINFKEVTDDFKEIALKKVILWKKKSKNSLFN
ncbi:MAG: nucleotidyltransferase domain-containing protein [Deltaproteobacteria bacterium]|nr:MAG: nucleotidyltransferase domain-containing protein [Deltaproteobacteria bacterium]